MDITAFQQIVKEKYGKEDKQRGAYFLFVVIAAEVGELADALKKKKNLRI